ncbi:MAG TPA: hypothetical protein DCZ07_03465, partial [Alphaproteobacteria bacterium]|nr:hypothetical protein [Alphaproteobacteria bacterium]HBA42011.1 hypothetical protein [Alphaproteobacteria bacterium]
IKQERPEAANENLARSRSLLVEILSMGNASGELDVPNVVDTAEMIQCATMKFRYPQLFSQLPLDALERELDGVIELLLRGIAGKQPAQTRSQVSA